MTADPAFDQVLTLERELRSVATRLTLPNVGECLPCFVYRMLELGCRGPRWIVRYRDVLAPRATALTRTLASKGAGCDCELFMNAYTYRPEHLVIDPESGLLDLPQDDLPACSGVRRGSTQPCGLWMRRPRGLW